MGLSNRDDFPEVGSVVDGAVESLGDRGATVQLNCGYTAYLPYSESRGGALRENQKVTVEVIDIGPGPRGGRSIRVAQV
ncbi:MAG: hypothetical protein K2Y39_27655 [Candidatus Obscuribacterales bacterium]|nr:hypothetical protein [Candidatus Obscuribacterales bacterium]